MKPGLAVRRSDLRRGSTDIGGAQVNCALLLGLPPSSSGVITDNANALPSLSLAADADTGHISNPDGAYSCLRPWIVCAVERWQNPSVWWQVMGKLLPRQPIVIGPEAASRVCCEWARRNATSGPGPEARVQ